MSNEYIEPPPSKVSVFNPQWIKWIYRFYQYVLNNVNKAPSMTTAERNALTATNGMIIYNTTTNVFNFYENGVWVTK